MFWKLFALLFFFLANESTSAGIERHGLVGDSDGVTFSAGRVTNGAKAANPSAAVAVRKVIFFL